MHESPRKEVRGLNTSDEALPVGSNSKGEVLPCSCFPSDRGNRICLPAEERMEGSLPASTKAREQRVFVLEALVIFFEVPVARSGREKVV